MWFARGVLPIRHGLTGHTEVLCEIALSLVPLTTECKQIGGCKVRHAVPYVPSDEFRKTLCMAILRGLCPSFPPGDSRLGDLKQGAELGLGIAQPLAGCADVLWLHHRVRCPPASYQRGYIIAVDDK